MAIGGIGVCCMLAHVAGAATVTPQVRVGFGGVLSNFTYSLGAGELDATGSFAANGSATIANGMADLPGDQDSTSGFYFNSSNLGSLATQNWLAEVVLSPDVVTANQPGAFNNFIDIQGDTYFRFNGNGQVKAPEFGFYDGTEEHVDTTVAPVPADRSGHLALTWVAATNTLEAFVNGVSQGTVTSTVPFTEPNTRVGFGFFGRDGFIGRAIDGQLDAVAFSTFTGAFNPASDFQLNAPAPKLTATINRDSPGALGRIIITNNSAASVPIAGYSVTSANGALDPTNWLKVTGRFDAPGGNGGGDGSIDPDDDWRVLSEALSHTDLSEFELAFPSGDGGALDPGESLDLGTVWRKVPGLLEDVTLTIADGQGHSTSVPISFLGNGGQSFPLGDLDFDGDVDTSDWQSYLSAAQSNLAGLSATDRYRTGGDLNNDGLSDLGDLDAFVTSYDALHGSGAFAIMIAGVPEPNTMLLLVGQLSIVLVARARVRQP